ncbi:hypothetical protein KR009_002653, partial [Drosophila setifemur]
SAFIKVVPRLLWNIRRSDKEESHRNTQQPIIIMQQPSLNHDSDSDRHHHHHSSHYPYYPYYPPPPPQNRPPPQFPGMDYQNIGSGPTYLIINPNNMQGIYLPSSNTSNSTSSRRSAFVPSIADLLQGLNFDDLADSSLFHDDSEVVNAADNVNSEVTNGDGSAFEAVDDHDDIVISDDEIDSIERHKNRGLSPKHLVSIIGQDNRRRRIQEVLAGIFLRNYNLNRK